MGSERRRIVLAAWLTVFIGIIGLGMIIPVVAVLFLSTNAFFAASASQELRKVLLGLVIATYPVFQFFGAPILGQLSDRYGRKPILMLSIAGTLIGYALSAIAILDGSLWLLFASRALDGLTGGNISVVYAILSDVYEGAERTSGFALVGMAFGFGFIIGPALGGVLSNSSIVSWFSYATPFWLATILSAVALAIAWRSLAETLPARERARSLALRPWSSLTNIAYGLRSRARTALSVFFLTMFGFAFFEQFFQVYLIGRFAFDQTQIGWLFAYVGLCVAIVQGAIVRRVSHRLEPRRVLTVSLLGLAVGLALLLAPRAAWGLYLIVPIIALAQGFSQPNLTTLIADAAGAQRGRMLGVQQSLRSASIALPPLLAGAAAAAWIGLPTLLGAGFAMLGWVVFTLAQPSRTAARSP